MNPRLKKKMLIYSIISFVSGFLGRFGSDVNFGFIIMVVSLFFYANVTVLMVKMKHDRFLLVVTERVTIILPVSFSIFSNFR